MGEGGVLDPFLEKCVVEEEVLCVGDGDEGSAGGGKEFAEFGEETVRLATERVAPAKAVEPSEIVIC